MKYAYYPGCSLKATAMEYDLSSKKVAESLGVEFWEIPDWNCCGASSAHVTNHLLSLALPARNLAIAEKEGLDVVIPCAACYSRAKATEVAVQESSEMAETISEIIERPYHAKIKVKSLLDIIVNDIGLEKIKDSIVKPLNNLKVASYYGCLLVRPKKIGFDDPENPQSLDNIIKLLGGTAVDWGFKTECCGASLGTSNPDVGLAMIEPILTGAKEAGADCIVTACPMCMSNLDMRQGQVESKFNKKYNLPVFYFTQLMGWGLGIDSKELGLEKHFVSGIDLLGKISDEVDGKGGTK